MYTYKHIHIYIYNCGFISRIQGSTAEAPEESPAQKTFFQLCQFQSSLFIVSDSTPKLFRDYLY